MANPGFPGQIERTVTDVMGERTVILKLQGSKEYIPTQGDITHSATYGGDGYTVIATMRTDKTITYTHPYKIVSSTNL